MKRIILLLTFLAVLSGSFAQGSKTTSTTLDQTYEQWQSRWKKSNPAQRLLNFYNQRAYPYETIPPGARQKALKQAEVMSYKQKGTAMLLAQQPEWRNIGPYDVGGRIKTVVHHPTQEGVVWVGAAAGGVWKTTDGGTTWAPCFDYENGIAFGSLAIDNNNPDILYAATGESSHNVDAYLGSGIYKTTNGGTSWNVIGLTDIGGFSKIYVHPMNSNLVVAGAVKRNQGFYKSTDGGATWTKLYDATISDISINPTNPDEFMIGVYGSGIYITNDGGASWKPKNSGLLAGIGRVSVQMAPSNTNICWALMENNGIGVIYHSADKGTNWSVSFNGGQNFFGPNSQGWYDNYILVNPKNPDIAIAGGIQLYMTTTGPQGWHISDNLSSGGEIHVDQHHAAFDPTHVNIIYCGNDGGMYKSMNDGASWVDINNNLQVTQFYALAIDNSKQNVNFGGTQDNGTVGNWMQPKSWGAVAGGDGFRVVVNKDNPDQIIGEVYYGQMWRRTLSTGSFEYIGNGIPPNDTGAWSAPITQDPVNAFAIYHGRHALYASYNYGSQWNEIAPRRSGQFSTIKVSPVNGEVLFAGNNMGEVLCTSDAGITWALVSENGLPQRFVTDIACSRIDQNIAYIGFSGYGLPHLYKTTDMGLTWTILSNGLPDAPLNAIVIHPENPQNIYVGTDVGVYTTYDGGLKWFPFGRGLAKSPVIDLAFHTNRVVLPNMVLRAATHGRSMWEIDIPADNVIEPEITSPAGGEIYISGTSHPILWYGFDPPVRVEYSLNNGNSWNLIAEGVMGNSLMWTTRQYPTINGRIRISSMSKPSQMKISNTFTIKIKEKGSILEAGNVNFVPYGITFDGRDGIWATSFYGNKLVKLSTDKFIKIKEITLPGDSLFTDLTMDRQNGIFYIHRMNSTDGGGGVILKIDTLGNKLKEFQSPARAYPIGLELVDGKLIVGDRDRRTIAVVDPVTGVKEQELPNACQVTYGPRGLAYDGSKYLMQVCTDFPGAGALTDAYIIRFDKAILDKEVDRMKLQDANGLINARGIEFDPRDRNIWITDFAGDIYKIAGFETVADVENQPQLPSDENGIIETVAYPNPMKEFSNISFNLSKADAHVQIAVYDLLGQLKATVFDKQAISGGVPNVIQLKGDNLVQGMYSIVFYVDGAPVKSTRLVVLK